MSRVLVVEDQPAVAQALRILLEVEGIASAVAATPAAALALAARESFGVAIQDMNFTPGETSGREGIELFRALRELDPGLPIVVLTAWSSLETAVQLVKDGASDYVAKPWDDAKLAATVRQLLESRKGTAPAERARGRVATGLVYASAAMERVAGLALQVAPSNVPVLITGPNGSGKERVAELVHAHSGRDGPLVKVHAGALPDDLLESELFGAEPGAYTGALRRRVGRFEAAHGGTLFLDEIGTMSGAGQVKLLRVLQSGEFERLGSSVTRRTDVRLVAATNVDLPAAIAAGRFREDLYFRVNVVEIRIPPLAARIDDILPLARHFVHAGAAHSGRLPPSLAPDAVAALLAHSWPGNVRELSNRVQRALVTSAEATLHATDFGFEEPAVTPRAPDDVSPYSAEREELVRLLLESEGMVSRAAERLGVSRQALYRRMERLGIALERRPRG